MPDFELPSLLTSIDGQTIDNVSSWESDRRPEILHIFREQMYGTIPDKAVNVNFRPHRKVSEALDGLAVIKEVDLVFSNENGRDSARLLLFLPKNSTGPVPTFLGINYHIWTEHIIEYWLHDMGTQKATLNTKKTSLNIGSYFYSSYTD